MPPHKLEIMTANDIIDALDFPASARIDRRVPKKLLVENGAVTAADKRRINEGIDDVHWIAALKPGNIGVPEFRDEVREYLEIEVLASNLHSNAQTGRIEELIHRAIPYPVFLITTHNGAQALSLAHKRWSQGQAGATVLDGQMVTAELEMQQNDKIRQAFFHALAIIRESRTNLFALYQGWMDTIISLLVSRQTGAFSLPESSEHAAVRRVALADCDRLNMQISGLRTAAAKEKQLARKVELNVELKRVQAEYTAARAKL